MTKKLTAAQRREETIRLLAYGYTKAEIDAYLNPPPPNPRVASFPEPECPGGYPWSQLEEVMDAELFAEFSHWMRGQTCMICDGRRYSHEDKCYYPDHCADNPHGGVAYKWDVHRFLELIPGKDIWD
jgi:hypothetical protein